MSIKSYTQHIVSIKACLRKEELTLDLSLCAIHLPILWKYIYSLSLIFVVSAKCIDPWVFEFVVSKTTDNNQWGNCISLDFNIHALSELRNP